MTSQLAHLFPLRLAVGAAVGLALSACGPSGETPTSPASEPPAAPAATPPAPAATPTAPAPNPTAPSAPPTATGATDAAHQQAQVIFKTRCFTCHGQDGHGDGPASAGLNPRPRNFHDPTWQDSVTDDHLRRIILLGGPAVGKSPLMPPNPDLANQPEVVAALAERIRNFRDR